MPAFHPVAGYGRALDATDVESSLDYLAWYLADRLGRSLAAGYASTEREAWSLAAQSWQASWERIVEGGGRLPPGYRDRNILTEDYAKNVFRLGALAYREMEGEDPPNVEEGGIYSQDEIDISKPGRGLVPEYGYRQFLISPGQTPSGIADAFGVDLQEFMRLNEIRDPRTGLRAWAVVRIPWGPDLVGGIPIEEVGNVERHFAPAPPAVDGAAAPAKDSASTSKEGGSKVPVFKDPTGKVLPEGSRTISNYKVDSSRPVIDKGDGSFLTPGNPKDAQWTADRIDDGSRTSLPLLEG